MWELYHKKAWAPENWCSWPVVLEKTPESPWECKEIQPVNPKGKQSWIFIGRADAEVETPILRPPDAKNWLIGEDPDAEQYRRQEEKGMTEDETVGWHHWLDGHEFEQAPGVDDGQGSLACCSPWDCKESDTTEWLNWTFVFLCIYAFCWGKYLYNWSIYMWPTQKSFKSTSLDTGEGNGTPLQYSCLENPMDRGAW